MNAVQHVHDMRKLISNLAESVGENLEKAECPVTHRFAPGVYLREIFMPKGSVVVGKIHTTEHFNVLIQGEVTVVTAVSRDRYQAPHTFVSLAGVQKVVFMHTDCIWQTIHPTDKTDIDEIEKEISVTDYNKLEVDQLLDEVGLLE